MDNRQIARQIKAFQATRKEWIDMLVRHPGNQNAPVHIMSINSKIELLTGWWNWRDETVEFPSDINV